MLAAVAYRPEGEFQPISVVFFLLVWLVMLTSSYARRMMANFQFAPLAGVEIWYEFADCGFRCGMLNSESRQDWAAIASPMQSTSQATGYVGAP